MMASAFLLSHSDEGSLLPDGAPYGIKGRPWPVSEWEGLAALCALCVGLPISTGWSDKFKYVALFYFVTNVCIALHFTLIGF